MQTYSSVILPQNQLVASTQYAIANPQPQVIVQQYVPIQQQLSRIRYIPIEPVKEHAQAPTPYRYRYYWLLPFLYNLVILILAIILINRSPSNNNVINSSANVLYNVQQNLDAKPIYKITSVQADKPCPLDYDQLVLGHWPGIKSGCMCTENSQLVANDPSYCESVFGDSQCQLQNSLGQMAIKQFKNTKFCGKTVDTYKTYGCDSSQNTMCQYQTCVSTLDTCPLNKIETARSRLLAEEESHSKWITHQAAPATYTTSIQGKTTSTYSFSKDLSLPLYGFTVSPGFAPCYNYKLGPVMYSSLTYPNLKVQTTGCDEYGKMDRYSQQIDSILLKDLYQENNLMDTLKQLPHYAKYYQNSQDQLNLIATLKIQVASDKFCQETYLSDYEKLDEKQYTLQSWVLFFEIIILVVSVITLLAGVIFIISYKLKPDVEKEKFVNDSKALFILAIALAAVVILWSIIYFFIWLADYGMKDTRKHLRGLQDKGCFSDIQINKAIQVLESEIVSIIGRYSTLIDWQFIITIVFLVGLALLIYLRMKKIL